MSPSGVDIMNKKDILVGLLVAIAIAVLLSPFASSSPDGLERVAEDKGFIEKGESATVLKSPFADYILPGVKNEKLSTALSGVAGTIIVFGVGYGLARLIKKRNNNSQ